MSQGLSMASVNKIKELANQREYSLCVDIIDSQDLTKSLNPQFLRLCGEIYLKEGRNEDARSPLVMAHRLAPGGKRVLLDLTDLYLRLGIRKLAETYKEIYEFEVGEDEAGKREMEYLWKKAEGADSRELLEYMEQYAQNLDYDLSFELFLLYVKAGEKEKASVLCEIFSATFKNTRYAGRMQSILDGETEPDKFLDVYASEEREDDDPDFMELRIEEQRQLKADDERVHPAEARITEMVDDYSVSNRKVRRFLKVQAKEEAKAAAEAALKSSEEDASKDKSEDKAFDKTEDKAEETAEEKTAEEKSVEVKTAEEKSAETVEGKTEETVEIETGEKAAETAEAKNEEKTEETVEDDIKDDTEEDREEVKVKYKREYKQAVKRKRKRNGKKKLGDPEENKSDDIDGAGQAGPDEKTEERAEYPEQDDANNISEKDVEEGTAETDEESGTDYTEELKKDETEESKPEDESGSAQSETDSGNSESSDNSENSEDTAEKAGSEDETDNEDGEKEKSEAGGIGGFFRKLKSKLRRTGDKDTEDTEDTEAETESEEDKKAETETEETNQSGEPEQSEQSEEPEQSEQSEQSGEPEQSEQSEQSEEPGQSEEPEDSQQTEDDQEPREFKVSESSSAVFESVEVDFSENEAETNESEYEVDDFLGENTEFEESVEEITEEPVKDDREEEIYEVWEDEPEPEESHEPEPENVDLSEMRAEDFPISYKKKKLEYPEFKTDLFKHHDTREVKETVNDFDEVVEKSRLSEKLKEEERLAREAEELLRSLGVGADDSGKTGFLEAEEYDALNESDKPKKEPQEESSPLEEYGISRKELKTRLKISSEKKDLLKKIRNQR